MVRVGVGVSLRREELEDSTAGNMVARHALETLVRTGPGMEVLPMLATAWEVDADGRRWRFQLRTGVRFHDGEPFDAEAVAYNFDPTRNPKLVRFVRRRGYLEPFAAVRVIGSHTLEIETAQPFAPMLRYLSLFGGWLESPRALARFTAEQPFTGLVGTGPFRYASGNRNLIELVANDDYYGGRPAIDRLVFRTVRAETDRLLLLEIGRLDAITGLPIFEIQRLRDEGSPVRIVSAPGLRVVALRLDTRRPPLDRAEVRRALAMAIDRRRIIERVLEGNGDEVGSMLSPLTFGYAEVANPPFDPAAALRLLAASGWAPPWRLTVKFRAGRYAMDQQVMEAVGADWRRIGIELVPLAAPDLRSDEGGETAQVTFTGWAPSCADGDWVLRPLFSSASFPPEGANHGRYANPVVDRLIEAGRTTLDPERRQAIYAEAQRVIAMDAPYIYLYAAHQVVGLRPELSGVEILPQEYLMFSRCRKAAAAVAPRHGPAGANDLVDEAAAVAPVAATCPAAVVTTVGAAGPAGEPRPAEPGSSTDRTGADPAAAAGGDHAP